jgi:chaperonin GroES
METIKNMRPTGKKIFILPMKEDNVTNGGIIIPDTVANVSTEGEVKSMDPTVRNIKVGDTVVYTQGTGSSLQIDGETYIMFREGDKNLHAIKNKVTGTLKLL